MAWEFNPEIACQALVNVIIDKVGDKLGYMILPDGTVTTTPACYLASQSANLPEPQLPFITVDFLASNDNNGFLFDDGVVTETIDDVEYSYPYTDVYLEYLVQLRAEGDESHTLLREVRNILLLDSVRTTLEEDIFSSIQLINPVTEVKDLLDTNYRKINTTTLTLNTVDRYVDRSGDYFNEIEYEGHLYRTPDDEDPLPVEGSVTTE